MIYLNIQWRLQPLSTIDWVHFWMHFLSVNNWLCCNIWNHTLLCSPCQQRSHCLFMSVFCLLFSFHTSLICPAEPNLKSRQNRPVPSSAFSFQFVVTRFGCVCPISPGDGLCPAGVLQRTVPAAIRPNTHTHTHTSHSTSPSRSSVRGMIVNIWDLVEIRTTYSSPSPNHEFI